MMKKTLLLLLLINGLYFSGYSQDLIIKVNKDTIKCLVKEIGDDEIKYTQPDFRGDVIFGIDKNKVRVVIFSDKKELSFQDSMEDPAQYLSQHKNALKIGFLSPLMGATSFSYEHSLKPGSSIEGTLGIIGLGEDISGTNPSGIYVKLGYKFVKSPDFYLKGMKYAHILKGSYVRPEISFAAYKSESDNFYDIDGTFAPNKNTVGNSAMFAVMINVGKQWVFQDRFLIDWFSGFGYGFGKSHNDDVFHYAFTGGSAGTSFAMTSGFRIGFLF
jgi:hypothetical protein